MTDDYTPSDEDVYGVWTNYQCFYADDSYGPRGFERAAAEMDRFIARVKRDAKAEAWDAFREGLAGHLDLATPRAWGFHHPCDPPGVRWEPTERDKALMDVADMLREDTANPYRDTQCPEETP